VKISYGITVHNEAEELQKLLDVLNKNIDKEDEIVVCVDGDDEKIRWTRPLHEFIDGCKTYSHLPPHEELSLYHPKTIQRQEEQNVWYNKNFSKEMNVRSGV